MARPSAAALFPAGHALDRPLSTRSIIASLLLGRQPPSAPAALLVRWCGLFGVRDGAARVTLSRMVEAGELTASDSTYELAGRVRARQHEQEIALVPPTLEWDGSWRMLLVRGGARSAADRAALRHAAHTLRLRELREGVWARPDNLAASADEPPAREVVAAQADWWRGTPDGGVDLAPFALDAWRDRGVDLVRDLRVATAELVAQPGSGETLAAGFEVGAASLQHVRRDLLFPDSLLPEGWPGVDLRAAYGDYLGAMTSSIAAWYR